MPVAIVTSQDLDRELIPEGVYNCLIDKIAEKEQFNRFNNAQEIGFSTEFVIQDEGVMRDKRAFHFFTPYLTSNSKLTALCRAVLGRDFTPEELAGIKGLEELSRYLLGKSVSILVKTRVSAKGTTYYQIKDFFASGTTQPVVATASPAPTVPPPTATVASPVVSPPPTEGPSVSTPVPPPAPIAPVQAVPPTSAPTAPKSDPAAASLAVAAPAKPKAVAPAKPKKEAGEATEEEIKKSKEKNGEEEVESSKVPF